MPPGRKYEIHTPATWFESGDSRRCVCVAGRAPITKGYTQRPIRRAEEQRTGAERAIEPACWREIARQRGNDDKADGDAFNSGLERRLI